MNAPLQPHTHFHKVELKPKDYKDEATPSFWCAGCGHYGVLTGLLRALSEIGVDPNFLVSVSGIGCSSRLPYFVNSYKMHTLHGRAGPVATGVQLARPDLAVVVTGGDGDGFSIGGGHMPHLARKNINMIYILMDNHVYGLTKGQCSPTSRTEMKTTTTPLRRGRAAGSDHVHADLRRHLCRPGFCRQRQTGLATDQGGHGAQGVRLHQPALPMSVFQRDRHRPGLQS